MLNKIQHQNKSQSKSPQFGHNRTNKSTSKSPDYPKMGDYKRNQLVQHLNKIKHKNRDSLIQEKDLQLSTTQQMELEVREFKKEIEKKFLLSVHNLQFKFPSDEQLSDDDNLKDLIQVTVYNLKQQNNTIQKDLVRKTFDKEKKLEQDIYSKMQNLIQKTQMKHDSQLRIRTEGDDNDLRILNNLKTIKKANYYKPQIKTQTLYDTIKQKKDAINILPQNILLATTNNILSQRQSPKYHQKTLNDSANGQKTIYDGIQTKSPLIVPRNQQRTELKSNIRLYSFKSNNSQQSRNQEGENTVTNKSKEKKLIKPDSRGMHNYYFSIQNNSSLQLHKDKYQTTNPHIQTQRQLHSAQIQEGKLSYRYAPSYSTTMLQNQSYRSRQQTQTTRNKIASQSKRNNHSNDSNHSDTPYKNKHAFQQDKLKELLKKSKPFYN